MIYQSYHSESYRFETAPDGLPLMAWIYNGGAIILAILTAITLNSTLLILPMMYPVLGIILLAAVRWLHLNIDVRPVLIGIGISAAGLFVNASVNYYIPDYAPLFVYMLPVFIAFGIALFWVDIKDNELIIRVLRIAARIVISYFYSFGIFSLMNCAYDRSAPKIYQSTITNQHISHGKSDSYLITVAPWGPEPNYQEENVTPENYARYPVGSKITMPLKAGYLGAPWYTLPE